MTCHVCLSDAIGHDGFLLHWETSSLPTNVALHVARFDEARSALQGVDEILEAYKLLTEKSDEGPIEYFGLDGLTTARLEAAKRVLFREMERRMSLLAKAVRPKQGGVGND
jgi:hypothetical protein